MTETKAKLKNYKQSPRKVRLVADLVRGKKVDRVISELSHLNKKVSVVMKKLIKSAVANAKHNNNMDEENLFLKTITVDEGPAMKRFKAGAKGRAFPFKRRTSHITVIVDEKKVEVEKNKEVKKKAKRTIKKEVKKEVLKTKS